MGEILVNTLKSKGYQAFLVDLPFAGESVTAEMLMAQYQAIISFAEIFSSRGVSGYHVNRSREQVY